MIEPPVPTRCTIVDTASGLRLLIPSRQHWAQISGLTIWLIIWYLLTANVIGGAVGGLIANILLASQKSGPERFGIIVAVPFLLIWMTLWVIGGVLPLYSILWQVFGCEVIEITSLSIVITRKVFGLGIPKRYDASRVKRFRLSLFRPKKMVQDTEGRWSQVQGIHTLAFDYGPRTVRFGDLTPEEARIVLEEIKQRCLRK